MGNTLERPTAPGDEFPWLFQQLCIQNHENRRLANALREENRRRRHPENRDRQPCRFYAQGFCFHGTDCRYAHDGPVTRTRQPDRRQREPCRFYAQGICTHGEACRFSHEGPRPLQETCRFFAKGFCKRGVTCRYAHDQPNTEWSDEPKHDSHTEKWTRELGGAWVEFGDGAAVVKITLLSDFSAIKCAICPRGRQHDRDPTQAFEAYYKLKNQQLNIGGLPVVAQMPAAADPTQKDGPWQMELKGLVATIPPEDIIDIFPPSGAPYQVEMGDPSYDTDSDIDSTMIKSLLYDVGALEQWEVFGSPTARRVKAQARFIQESEALDAVSQLNEMWLPFNPSGKLYLQHVHLVKFRVSSRVYCVVEDSIEPLRKDWERQFVYFSSVSERGYRVLKLESQDREPFTQAKETLEQIINGTTMTLDGKNLWSSDFKADRGVYRRLQDIEQDLGVVIIRDIKSSKFRVFGPEDKFLPACEALDQLLQEIQPRSTGHNTEKSRTERAAEGDCAVCFCEADQALTTSCGHIYCTICFVNMCLVEASMIGDFSIKCIGDQGNCKKAIPLLEIQNLLLSEIFESVLEASFASFMRRHQDQLRYCPTPECSQVYRIAQPETRVPPIFTCAKCLTVTCTSCHVSHPRKTCAQYKGDASGGMAELLKAKEELGFKDCPKCNTHIQKDEGCNHINCSACGAHICWLCLKTFRDGDDCYQHMGRIHGGIGDEGEDDDDIEF
ncbi:hypothetical protein BFJ63_vAg7404 [Fusarium oxysporum f. sp. narcissi]|uniref:Ariadne-2 protein n=1 Tax=Fusarium oxysporum f. sp. narcissi TaxID=451672 RepID=A0A4Q2VSS0_FUSOX|nr:hypothetical protein BFJ63_vAg7404 [Fusarium oxysporum f. sp. narcissi]